MEIEECPICGDDYKAEVSDSHERREFCSRSCFQEARTMEIEEGDKSVFMFGHEISLGDYLKVEFTGNGDLSGGRVSGKATEIWNGQEDDLRQIRVGERWCVHDKDKLIHYKEAKQCKN